MAQNDQAEPAYCTFKEQRGKVKYRCIREVHKDGAHTLKKHDELSDALKSYFAKTTLAELEDTDLVRVDTQAEADATLAKRLHRTARLTERKRHTTLLDYEVGAGDAITEAILALDESRWAENLLADTASLQRIKQQVDAWLLQRGIREDGGS